MDELYTFIGKRKVKAYIDSSWSNKNKKEILFLLFIFK
jgi:hypothetical protein